jgi:hypothetical protein
MVPLYAVKRCAAEMLITADAWWSATSTRVHDRRHHELAAEVGPSSDAPVVCIQAVCHVRARTGGNCGHPQTPRTISDLGRRSSEPSAKRTPKQPVVPLGYERLTTEADRNDIRHSPIERVTWKAKFPGERRQPTLCR